MSLLLLRSSAPLYLALAATAFAADPSLDPLQLVRVPAGKTVIVPITARSAEGLPLAYTLTSSVPAAVTAIVHTNNPWLKLGVAGFGILEFQLLRDRAPYTVDTILGFVQSGFYNGLRFHRVDSEFVIQGGDPLGTGFGGPSFRFEDEFDPHTLFTGHGQLAMANSGKDSNGSQFFITMGPERLLDFNHTIFGQLVRGFEVFTNITRVAVDTNEVPLSPVIITNASLCTNIIDAVITVFASPGPPTNAELTLVARDSAGRTATRILPVQRFNDGFDTPPILVSLTNRIVPTNSPVQIPLEAYDVESNALEFAWQYLEGPGGASGGLVGSIMHVTPPAGYVGPMRFLFAVRQAGAWFRGSSPDPFDYQVVTLAVGDAATQVAPTNFVATNHLAFSNVLATFTHPNPALPATNFNATINWGDGTLTTAAGVHANASATGFNVVGSHRYTNAGDHPVVTRISTRLGHTAWTTSIVMIPPAVQLAGPRETPAIIWPAWACPYELVSAPTVGGPWNRVTNQPGLQGFYYKLGFTNWPGTRFFQLRR